MATHSRTRRFERDWKGLSAEQRLRFRAAFERFAADLDRGSFRPGLRVRGVEGTDRVFEMTWAPDGRATFEYGEPINDDVHVIWRRVGTHDVFRTP